MPLCNPSPFPAFELALRLAGQLAVPLLLVLGGMLLAGALVRRGTRGERLLAALLLTVAGGSLSTVVLGSLGILGPVSILVAAVLWVVLGFAAQQKAGPPAELEPLLRDTSWATRLALAGLAVLALPYAWRALGVVIVDWDGLNYHAYKVARWVQEGSLVRIEAPNPYDWTASYPAAHEAFVAQLTGVLRNELLAKTVNLPLIAGLVAALTALGSRLRLPPEVSLAGALMVVGTPALFGWAATTYVDHLLALGLVASLLFTLRAAHHAGKGLPWRDALLAGVAMGLALGAKYSALPLALLLGAAHLGLGLRRPDRLRATAVALVSFGGAAALVGGFWYLQNWWVTGSPVWPVPVGPFEGAHDPLRSWDDASILGTLPWLVETQRLYHALTGHGAQGWNHIGLGRKWPMLVGLVGLGIPVMLVAGLRDLWRRRPVKERGWLLVGVATLLMLQTWLSLPYWNDDGALLSNTRFAMPGLCVAVLGAAAALHWLRLPAWVLGVVALLALGLDAATLDLHLPGLDGWRWWVLGVTAVVAGGLAMAWRRVRSAVAPALALLLLAGTLGAWPLLSWRETHRHGWYATSWEGHATRIADYVPCLEALDELGPDRPTALSSERFPSYFYPFLGPFWQRPAFFVPVRPGLPGNTYLGGRPSQRPFDPELWASNLDTLGVEVLVVSRLDATMGWAREAREVAKLDWERTYQDRTCRIYERP